MKPADPVRRVRLTPLERRTFMAIISGGHLFFTHNAMVESTRRGARYYAQLRVDIGDGRTAPRRDCASETWTLRSVKRWPPSTWPEYGITW